MRVLVQRVLRASVTVGGRPVGAIGPGLLLFVGVRRDDDPAAATRLATKVANLRIFADEEGRMQRSVLDVGGGCLVVPQFTLYGDARRGRRPSFDEAASPEEAAGRVEALATALADLGVPVARGAFREHMAVDLVNDGPVTIWLEDPVEVRGPGGGGARDTMPA